MINISMPMYLLIHNKFDDETGRIELYGVTKIAAVSSFLLTSTKSKNYVLSLLNIKYIKYFLSRVTHNVIVSVCRFFRNFDAVFSWIIDTSRNSK